MRRIGYVCRTFGLTTQQLTKMSAKEEHSLIIKVVSHLKKEGKSRGYIKNYDTAIKQFFAHNGKPISQKTKIPRDDESRKTKAQIEQVPTQLQFANVLDSVGIEVKVRAALIGLSGFRPETLGNFKATDGLRLKDMPELKIDNASKKIEFQKIPTQIICRPNLSKAGHRYFSFMPAQGCGYIQQLLEQRLRDGENLTLESFLITSLKYAGIEKTDYKGGAISTSKISSSVRKALRKAGLDVRPYVLRSYFETWLMTSEVKGLFLRDYRVFVCGHKGNIENRYSTHKEGLPTETLEQMRSMFANAAERYLVTVKSHDHAVDKLRAESNKRFLMISGFTEEQIKALGELGSIPDEKISELIAGNHKQALGLNGNSTQRSSLRTNWKIILIKDGSMLKT